MSFARLPLGRLNPSFQQVGYTADSSVNCGHRANAGGDHKQRRYGSPIKGRFTAP